MGKKIKVLFFLLCEVVKETFRHRNAVFYVFIVSVAEADSLDRKPTLQIQVRQTELCHTRDL